MTGSTGTPSEDILREPAEMRRDLGHYPTGVCVVTSTAPDGDPLAMVMGTFTSVSLDPPLVGLLPMRTSHTWSKIKRNGLLCINVLAHDQMAVCQRLAKPRPGLLEGVPHTRSDAGIPLIDGALMHLHTRIASVTEAGDHWFVQCSIRRLAVMRHCKPLIFHKGEYRTLAGL